jgi:hypothetical protein
MEPLRSGAGAINSAVKDISGLIPPEVNARAEYRDHVLSKHREGARSQRRPGQ